ncbi:MAG TPA: phosphotransferase [Streptosporangiaceae bacterium]|jgi:hypothetical protein
MSAAGGVNARVEGRVRSRLHQLCPQFTPSGPFSCTETSIIVPGRVADAGVVAKHPIDTRPFWQARARHEITTYTVIASAGQPPVPIPRMLLADPALPLILLTMMPGTPLGPDRYPVNPLPQAHLDWLLDATGLLHDWRDPALSGIPADTDYAAQFQILPADLFSSGELSALAAEAARLTSRIGVQLEHGDAHPGNALVLPGTPLALIDLELLAHRLPGYDLAVLWTITGPSPELRSRITARIGPGPQRQDAFWLNVILATGREILSHRRNAPTALHRDRLARLLNDLREGRARARQALMPGLDEGHLT